MIDYAELEKQVKKVRPKLIVAGASAYPRAIDFEKIAEIAHGYGAFLMVDMPILPVWWPAASTRARCPMPMW